MSGAASRSDAQGLARGFCARSVWAGEGARIAVGPTAAEGAVAGILGHFVSYRQFKTREGS